MSTTGQRNRLVTIQQLTESRDATTREPVESWTTLRQAYMSVDPMRGSERFAAHQTTAAGDTVWEMPYVEDMDPEVVDVPKSRRLLFRGRVYDITSAIHEGMRACIELTTLSKADT